MKRVYVRNGEREISVEGYAKKEVEEMIDRYVGEHKPKDDQPKRIGFVGEAEIIE